MEPIKPASPSTPAAPPNPAPKVTPLDHSRPRINKANPGIVKPASAGKPKVKVTQAAALLLAFFMHFLLPSPARAALPGVLPFPSQPIATIVPTQTYYGYTNPNFNVTAGLGSVFFQYTNGLMVEWFCTNSIGNTNWVLVLPAITTNGAAILNASLLGNQPANYYASTGSVASITSVGGEYALSSPTPLPIDFVNGLVENNLLRAEGTNALDPANTNVLFNVNSVGAASFVKRIFTNNQAGEWIMADASTSAYVYSNTSLGMYVLTNVTATSFYTNITSQNPWGVYTNGVNSFISLVAPLRINGVEQAFYAQTNTVSVTNTSSAIQILQQAQTSQVCQNGATTNLYPNEIFAGTRFRISARGTYGTAGGNAQTLTVTVTIGGTTAATTTIAAASMATSQNNHIEIEDDVDVIGVSAGTASCFIDGGVKVQSGTSLNFGALNNSGAGFTLSNANAAPQPVSITLQWSGVTAGDYVLINQAAITKLN